jgi:hypothetical protein
VCAESFIAVFTGVASNLAFAFPDGILFTKGLAGSLLLGVIASSRLGVPLSSGLLCCSSLEGAHLVLLRKRIACAALILASSKSTPSAAQSTSSSIAGAKRERNGTSTYWRDHSRLLKCDTSQLKNYFPKSEKSQQSNHPQCHLLTSSWMPISSSVRLSSCANRGDSSIL